MFSKRNLIAGVLAAVVIAAGVIVYVTVIYEKPLGPPSGYSYDHETILEGPVIEEWVVHYNNPGTDNDEAFDMVVDSEGNVYVTGNSGENTVGQDDFVTVKYDGSGKQLWTARYDGPASKGEYAVGIAVDSQNNVCVAGVSEGEDTWADFATVKYDSRGKELWVARYEGPGMDYPAESIYVKPLAIDKSDNIYVIGRSSGDYLTVKYDSEGNELWTARYPGKGDESFPGAHAIAVDESGNVYVAGDYYTVKYDSNGQQVWVISSEKSNDRTWIGIAMSMAIDSGGNLYVKREGIEKYDPEGNLLWSDLHNDDPADPTSWTYAMTLDEHDNAYITGWFEQGPDDGTGKGNISATIKYDADGNRLWTACYDLPQYPDFIGGYIIVDGSGNTYVWDRDVQNERYDYLMIKLDSNGDHVWSAGYRSLDSLGHFVRITMALDHANNVYVTGYTLSDRTRYCTTIKYSQL